MKIDIVIGNPPYNRGMDIDFISKGFDITSNYLCMIVPAKWKSADADQNISSTITNYGDLRDKITKHIRSLVFYPCCKDIFNILQVDGINYFIADKNKIYTECKVINKSKYIDIFNSVAYRDICGDKTLVNIGQAIVDNLGVYDSFEFKSFNIGRYQVWTNKKTPGGGFATIESYRKLLILGESHIEDTNELNHWQGRAEDSSMTFSSDKLSECKSFTSYINTRFVRFFVAINISRLTGLMDNSTFKFVPPPPVDNNGNYLWDREYTDEYLYKLYNLSNTDINIIESVIKSR